jgi:protein-disulfide isomerase
MSGNNFLNNGFISNLLIVAVVVAVVTLTIWVTNLIDSRIFVDNASNKSDISQLSRAKIGEGFNENSHIRGNVNAPITILEYSDFQCPFCQKFNLTLKRILSEYPNDLRTVYRHFPLDDIHLYARKSAEASECANDQGKFWDYHGELYANQSSISSGGIYYLKQVAEKLELNMDEFNKCLDSGRYQGKVESHFQIGLSAGVTGTPGSFINGVALGNAISYKQLKLIIDKLLE